MNDAALIATEIQDLASSVGEVTSAINKRPPTQVTVNVPEQAPPTVEVNVQAPVVNLEPQVTVPAPEPRAYEVRITERDRQGLILSFVITPQPG